MLGFGSYNYGRFTCDILRESEDGAPFLGPEPGERAPDFKATTLQGESVRLSDYAGRKNVLLVFGSATCPMTAGSIKGLNHLYGMFQGDDVEFLFVYVREAHPGERIGAHLSEDEKSRAAHLLYEDEEIAMPVIVDDLRGSIHRKYSKLPNPAFLIDKSGSVAFRGKWAKPYVLREALEELLQHQHEHGDSHKIVHGGQDLAMPLSYAAVYSFRALERGGRQALDDFREAVGMARRHRPKDVEEEAEDARRVPLI